MGSGDVVYAPDDVEFWLARFDKQQRNGDWTKVEFDDSSEVDTPYTPDDFQRLAMATHRAFPTFAQNLNFAAMGLAEEAGEVVGLVNKILFHGHPLDDEKRAKLINEVGDLLWYAAALLTHIDVAMSLAMLTNNEKLRVRYGRQFSTEASIARVDVPREELDKQRAELVELGLLKPANPPTGTSIPVPTPTARQPRKRRSETA